MEFSFYKWIEKLNFKTKLQKSQDHLGPQGNKMFEWYQDDDHHSLEISRRCSYAPAPGASYRTGQPDSPAPGVYVVSARTHTPDLFNI